MLTRMHPWAAALGERRLARPSGPPHWPYGVPPAVLEAAAEATAAALLPAASARCDDGESAERFARALARRLQTAPELVVPVPGADAGLRVLASLLAARGAVAGGAVLAPWPSYEGWLQALEEQPAGAPRVLEPPARTMQELADATERALQPSGARARELRVQCVFLTRPNALLGYDVDLDWLRDQTERRPDVLWVVDEALAELAPPLVAARSAARLARDRSNLVVARTMSKSHGLAGLRVGALVAGREDALLLGKLVRPADVSGAACAAAAAALEDRDAVLFYDAVHADVQRARAATRTGLRGMAAVTEERRRRVQLAHVGECGNSVVLQAAADVGPHAVRAALLREQGLGAASVRCGLVRLPLPRSEDVPRLLRALAAI